MELPAWATQTKDREFVVDVDTAYPLYIKELGIKDLDQYWLETVYQFVKLDLQRHLMLNGVSPWGKVFKFKTTNKEKWRQKNYPKGRGPEVATKGKEARALYKEMRGFIPK